MSENCPDIQKQRKVPTSKIFLSLLLFFFLLGLAAFLEKTSKQKEGGSPSFQQTKDKPGVLGARTPQIFISGGEEGYGAGGMIALASTDEPSVEISSYNVSGSAEVTLFEANEDVLLDYLTHNKEGYQIKKDIDVGPLRYVTKINHQITSGYGPGSKLVLPIEGSGIWLLKIKLGTASESAFVVRSNIGAIVKEGDNEYIFWGQSFKTRKSVSEGTLKIYNLLDGRKEIATVSFNDEGIAKTPLLPEADIALVRQGEDRAVVPINLLYLNSRYEYRPFQPKSRQTKYFIFTDRPLYRPGDTIYFKSVLRDDDDARYTIPRESALVKIYKDWDEKNTVFEKNYEVSAEGTVYGEYKLPEDSGVGYYQLKVDVPNSSSGRYWPENTVSFHVEYFRKPEYSIEVTTPKTELVAQDRSSFIIRGNYFSGQPLGGQTVKYTVYSADFYEYEYLIDQSYALGDDYRFGYWGGNKVGEERQVTLNQRGEAEVDLEAKPPQGTGKSQVFSVEAEFDDGQGNPAFARKNILVYSGEYGIYRKDSNYGAKVGTQLTLPIVLVSHRDSNVSGIDLLAKVHRENWIPYQEPDKKYPSYRKEEEDLPGLSAKTGQDGNATFSFVPAKVGSYKITVSGKDTRENPISKEFYFWVRAEDQPFYGGAEENELTIRTDKAKYSPSDTVSFSISSNTPDRDIFLSLERARVNRFQVVHLAGKNATVDIPLVETDIPNIYAKVSSFSGYALDGGWTNVVVSADTKKLVVNLTPSEKTFGPGEVVTVNIQTTDVGGNPISADTAVWAVDKALFELVDERPEKIFDKFWQERYNDTQESDSLAGILVYRAEGGGCFAAGTKILIAPGKTKNIEEVKIGDTILTRKGETDPRVVQAKVKGTHKSEVSGYLIINENLKVTPNHRLWVNNSWQEAGSITPGDTLIDFNDRRIVVSSIEWQQGKFTVYNLEVEKYRTYFAGGAWVHNQKGNGARTVFKDTAYWNPKVTTDANGRAQVKFVLPDNLTTWVMAAIGATVDTKVGQTTTEIVVTKDVIVRPILPNILRKDDEILLSALVQNFTDTDKTFDIDLAFNEGIVQAITSDEKELESATHSAILVKSKETERVYWKVSPKTEKEKAKLTFSATSREDKKIGDTITQEIPVWAFGFWEKRGEVGDGEKTFSVELAPDSDKKKSKATLSLSPTLVGTLPTAMRYLIHYPYGCVEQTTSSFVPAVIAKENPDLFGASIADLNVDDIIKKGVNRLAKLQHPDGGWSWWWQGRSDSFVTVYVVEYLLKARGVGSNVDPEILGRAQRFLEQEDYYDPQTNGSKKYDRQEIIAKTYGLSLLGSEKGKTRISDFSNITAELLAMAVMTNIRNGDTNPATSGLSRLISMAKREGDSVYWEAGRKEYFGSQDASTALAIRAIVASGGERELAVKVVRYLTRNRKSDYWSNTFATAQVIRALVDFSKTGEELTPNYNYTVWLDEKEISRGTVNNLKELIKDIDIPVSDIKPDGSSIKIEKSGEGQLYTTLLINEFHTDRGAPASNHGLEVKREYISDRADGSLVLGDTVTVKITIGGLRTNENYGIITDELPSGLIPINPVFKNEQYGQELSSYYTSYDVTDREVTENGIVLSLYQIAEGLRTYAYKARVVSEGEFLVPPAMASLMYSPEIYGRGEVQLLKIKKNLEMLSGREIPPKTEEKPVQGGKKGNVIAALVIIILLALWVAVFFFKLRGKTITIFRKPSPPDETQTQDDQNTTNAQDEIGPPFHEQ